MRIVRDQTFGNAAVPLDGTSYEACSFVECRLIYSGTGPVGLTNCNFRDCSFGFEGAAANTVSFLNALAGDPGLRLAVPSILPDLEMAPLVEPRRRVS